MIVLGIETSCDETAASVVEFKNKKKKILSNVLYSQFKEHSSYGGVVPEIAFREHIKLIDKITLQAIKKSKKKFLNIDAIAATGGPGLHGGLLIGTTTAKGLALSLNKPFIAINHLEGHILSPRLENNLNFPYLVLLVTGGHTMIVIAHKIGKYEILGATLDDALGESYDKIAKLLNLGFPGGPQIETFAKKGHPIFNLSKPLLNSNDCNFSFSGLKTSTIRNVELEKNKKKNFKYDICASFQHAVYKILETKCKNAFQIFKNKYPNKNNFVVVGGVASNNFIRQKIKKLAKSFKFNLIVPKKILCTDNAAMIAWTAIEKYKFIKKNNFHFQPLPQWSI